MTRPFPLMKRSTHDAEVAALRDQLATSTTAAEQDRREAVAEAVEMGAQQNKALLGETIELRNQVAVLKGKLVAAAHQAGRPA